MSIIHTAAPASPRSTMVRRRGTTADPLKKVTLRLHERVANAVKAVVSAGEAPSADAFVEQAVVAALRERRREGLYAAYAEAAADPAFMAEMDQTARTFDVTLADGREAAAR